MSYQVIDGERREVASSFLMRDADTVGFVLGAFDGSRELIIDPVLSYAEYLGGSNDEWGYGIAVKANGTIYFAGTTGTSQGLYITSGAFDTTYNGPPPGPLYGTGDIFVRKIANGIVYSTYLGGTGNDFVTDLAIDSAGNAYIAGNTLSVNGDFPLRNAYQVGYGGGGSQGMGDAFLTKLNATGSDLIFSTYLGGTGEDAAYSVAVDAAGNAYLTGETSSANFPVLNAMQPAHSNPNSLDAFVAKFTTTGSVVYATYFGIDGTSSAGTFRGGIAVDAFGNAYVAGNGPVITTPGAYNSTENGAFVAKFNPSGSALEYSTYLAGGTSDDLAIDLDGNAYVTGTVNFFNAASFVTTPGAYQASYGGGNSDAFVTKLNAAGTGLAYSTFLGGSGLELFATGIAVDAIGNAHVVGGTTSGNFPLADPIQAFHGGGFEDAFVTKFNAAGTGLIYSTYLGGSDSDRAESIALDGSGNAYITGGTRSSNFPTVPQDQKLGFWDAFIAKIKDTSSFVQFAMPSYVVHEFAASIKITLSRLGNINLDVSLQYTLSDGTAQAGFDYTFTSGTLFFPAGKATKTFTIPILNDVELEGSQTVNLTLSSPSPGAFLGLFSSAVLTILDDESPPGADDLGFFRRGSWTLDANGDRIVDDASLVFDGLAGGKPVVGDWDGDGISQLGIFRGGTWTLDSNGNGVYDLGVDQVFSYGQAGDKPVVGDWNNDNIDEVGVYRAGTWLVDFNGSRDIGQALTFFYGGQTDAKPVVGDWNGDGTDDVGIYRSEKGKFILDLDANFSIFGDGKLSFDGSPGGKPVIGDWDGNGTDERGIYRNGAWKLDDDGNGTFGGLDRKFYYRKGTKNKPVVGKWPVPLPLQLAVAAADGTRLPRLTDDQLAPLVHEAVARFRQEALSADQLALLDGVRWLIRDLPGSRLGETTGNVISLDLNAAGYGWFVDPTPGADEEYSRAATGELRADSAGPADARADLLTVIRHELGHLLGLPDLDPATNLADPMAATLPLGVRR